MKRLLILSILLLSACTPNPATPTTVLDMDSIIQNTIRLAIAENPELNEFDCGGVVQDLEKQAVPLNLHPQQITHCYSLADLSIAFVEQPNTWTPLPDVRTWEKEGNIAWGGLIVKPIQGDNAEVFLKLDEDFNPINLFTTKDSLVLDTVDDSGAGSGEGTLQRYIYPTAGVAEENLFQWTKEKCTSYYIPETYNSETDCN